MSFTIGIATWYYSPPLPELRVQGVESEVEILSIYLREECMYRKFIELLRIVTEELIERNGNLENILLEVDDPDLNLFKLIEELRKIERESLINTEEADTVKVIIAYLFQRNTDMDIDDIYSIVFGDGKKIIWN